MAGKSSYLRYLPPVLWENEPEDPEFSLGAVLRVFEKILTGVPDEVTIQHGDHVHAPIMEQIAQLDRLFDPWKTPEKFLSWLASWVALEFPTLQGQRLWDEYQRRKVTAEIARIYRLRGLKAGLNSYLDLYAVGRLRPRIALDDGSRVLAVTPRPAQLAPVAALVNQGPVLRQNQVWAEGLVRPWCVAVGADGNIFLGDIGAPEDLGLTLKNRVWRISAAGQYDLAGTPPKPRPLADTQTLAPVVAVAVRPAQAGNPETLYVLDRTGKLFAVTAPYLDTPAKPVTSLAGTSFYPVAMCVDGNNLLVLDRGGLPGTPSAPKIITVSLAAAPTETRPLQRVAEPLSMLVQPDETLIVGDAGDQPRTGPAQSAGNLVRVDRRPPTGWTETPLLPPANPLVAPTGVTRIDDNRLHVLDVGLKPFWPESATDSFTLAVAEPAAVYRVDLGAMTTTRVTEPGWFVYPTGMAADGERLIICDPGLPTERVSGLQSSSSRVRPFQFDVVIHFAESRLPPDPHLARKQAVGNIQTIIEQQKPAHTLWNLVTEK